VTTIPTSLVAEQRLFYVVHLLELLSQRIPVLSISLLQVCNNQLTLKPPVTITTSHHHHHHHQSPVTITITTTITIIIITAAAYSQLQRVGLDQHSCATLSPVSSGMGDCLRAGKLSHYATNHPSQLSLPFLQSW